MNDPTSQFTEWLRHEMTRRGYKIEGKRAGGASRLAARAGVPGASMSRLLNGQTGPSYETLIKIGEALGYSKGQMLVFAGWATPEELVRGIDLERMEVIESPDPTEGVDLPPGFDASVLPDAEVAIYCLPDTPLAVRQILVQTWRLAMGEPMPGAQHVLPDRDRDATDGGLSAAN